MSKKKFYTPVDIVNEVFDHQISKATIMTLLQRGEIPSIRMGHRWYIPAFWVEERLQFAEGKMADKAMAPV